MPMIVQQGAVNTTALTVPDLYVQIVPPQTLLLNGVPTNVLGVVGTASWGPVGQAVTVGSVADYVRAFGPIKARKYDAGTQVATAALQGANAFKIVRVTDGTEVKATATVLTTCLTVTAVYPGTFGNSITVATGPGSKSSTFKAVISAPGQQPEVYDNIAGTGNDVWVNMAAAINTGNGVLRGPSQLVTATAGIGTTAVATATYTLTTGTDGGTVDDSDLLGVDTVPRTGLYALRSQNCSVILLADADGGNNGASNNWTTQAAFGLAEGAYMICTGPAGDSIANAKSQKASSGVDTYAVKLMLGDWVYWQDDYNGVTRLVSPQGFVAGRLANLSPEQSSLNKPLYGIIGTQKSGLSAQQVTTYSYAELQDIIGAGLDVIANPAPGGNYYAVRAGHNSSSNPAVYGDNYTRLTNYIASTLAAGMGVYIGELISLDLFRRIKGTLTTYLSNMVGQNMVPRLSDGSLPFAVICDPSNNPDSRTGLGYVQADVQIRYGAINERFIVNLEGGQTVTVNRQTLPSGQVGA